MRELQIDPHRRLDSLDGLRALAVLLVFVHHVDQGALPGGFLGVSVFFVLSGFLISGLLLREHDSRGSIRLRRFYVRRLLRLWPALIVLVVFTTPLAVVGGYGTAITNGLAAAFYLTDFNATVNGGRNFVLHTWSLSVEEQFYLVWPLLLLAALRWASVRTVVLLVMVGSFVLTGVVAIAGVDPLTPVEFFPLAHVPLLGAGILLALAVRRPEGPGAVMWAISRTPVALVALAVMVASLFFLENRWWVPTAAIALCLPPVAHLVLRRESKVSAAFSARPCVWLGQRSYGFYLWHYPVLFVGLPTAPRVVLGLIATLMLTEASWRFVEQPFNRLKNAT